MLNSLITSKTRIKLLLRLFLVENSSSYLREMEKEFGDPVNSVRTELNRFEDAGLIIGFFRNGKKYFRANTDHPLFCEINNILKKFVGIDRINSCIASKVNDLEAAYLSGSLASGLDSDCIELLLVGQDLDDSAIRNLVSETEKQMERRINYLLLTANQMNNFFAHKPVMTIWKAGIPLKADTICIRQ